MYNSDMVSGDVACNIVHIIVCIIGSGGGTYFFGNLEDLRQIHTSYIGGGVYLRETRCNGCQII